MINTYSIQNGTTWQDSLKELESARSEYAKYAGIMTEFERQAIQKKINEFVDSIQPKVLAGAFAEFEGTVKGVQDKESELDKAKANEVKRWDAAKLNAEMQFVKTQIENKLKTSGVSVSDPAIVSHLKGIYTEAKQSGDLHKQRAAAEVFSGLQSYVNPALKIDAVIVATGAKKDLEAIRSTPEIQAAEQAVNDKISELRQSQRTLMSIDRTLGYTQPNGELGCGEIIRELGRLRRDEEGKTVLEP